MNHHLVVVTADCALKVMILIVLNTCAKIVKIISHAILTFAILVDYVQSVVKESQSLQVAVTVFAF